MSGKSLILPEEKINSRIPMKYFINNILKSFGYQVKKYPDDDLRRRITISRHFSIDIILDVGANTGQFAMQMRDGGYMNRIVSFEPLSKAFSILERNSSGDMLWAVHNYALGNENKKGEINISANSYSSSINDILEEHIKNAPDSAYIGKEEIEIRRLDSVIGEICEGNEQIMLKIDTQGYEKFVLEGAEESINKIKIIQIEMHLVPLYKNEILYTWLLNYFADKGFKLYSLENGLWDRTTGRLMETDAIFVRE